MDAHSHWTAGWTHAEALAISTWTRHPRALASRDVRRMLEIALEIVVRRERLALHAHVVLPSGLHVVGGRAGRDRLPWPLAVARAKACHARWTRGWTDVPRPAWRTHVRVQPLAGDSVREAIERLHAAPVKLGLCARPGEWDASSWRQLYDRTRDAFVRPWPDEGGSELSSGSR